MEESGVKEYLEDGAKVRLNLDYSLIYRIGKEIGRQIIQGKKLLIFGNGGSAADAQHIAAEFVGRFEKEPVYIKNPLKRYQNFTQADTRKAKKELKFVEKFDINKDIREMLDKAAKV